jgi:hypothetical protein
MTVNLFCSLKLLKGKYKCVMCNVSHSTTDTISKILLDIVIFCFPSPILKDEYVSHTSIYNGSCKQNVDTNRSDVPISKYVSTMISLLNK